MVRTQIEAIQTDAEYEFYLLNLADNVRLTERQGGTLYGLVHESSKVLGIPAPHVFLDHSPVANASALGGPCPALVFTSALIDEFSEPEIRAIIGHELGHILCRHTFFRILAEHTDVLGKVAGMIPMLGPLVSIGIQWSLSDWYRKSELSADRAALLATQDLDAVKRCIMRLAGGSARLETELQLAEFETQAQEFEERMRAKRQEAASKRIGFLFSGFMRAHALSPHPWPAIRLREVERFAESPLYSLCLAGDYAGAEKANGDGDVNDPYQSPIPGEDLKEYMADVGKAAGDLVKGLFKGIGKGSASNS